MENISREQIIKHIRLENPWWREPFQIDKPYSDMKPRPYMKLFYPLVAEKDVRRAVVLMGPRRVGKTVMMYHTIQKLIAEKKADPRRIGYVSVDRPIFNGMGMDELFDLCREASGVKKGKGWFLFFDEIQYMDDWERHLKALVDIYHADKFIVSGSAAAALKRKSLESGAGRFTDFILPPLLFYEYMLFLGKENYINEKFNYLDDKIKALEQSFSQNKLEKAKHEINRIYSDLNDYFLDYLNKGGYPEAIFNQDIKDDSSRFIKNDIIDKVLLRDLPSIYGISDIRELNSLFNTIAFSTGREFSLDDLSQHAGISKNTIKKYIEYLEAAFLIRIIHRIDRSAKRFKRANFFKIYLTNPSLRSALFSSVSPDDPIMGFLCETAVFSQYFHWEMSLYYARWDKGEIDLVQLDAHLKPLKVMEVKWSDNIVEYPRRSLRNLLDFCHEHNISDASVTTKSILKTDKIENVEINFIPVSFECLIAGQSVIEVKTKLAEQVPLFKLLSGGFQQ